MSGAWESRLEALIEQPADQDRAKNWDGPYLLMPLEDPWDNEFQYAFPGARGGDETRPDIWSLGPDGKDNTEDDIGNWERAEDREAYRSHKNRN
jgi:general secretion pathway protein G